MTRRIKEGIKEEREIQSVISSLSVLHSWEYTKKFAELGREEKGEGLDRGDLVEKKGESKGGDFWPRVRPVTSLPSKNGY